MGRGSLTFLSHVWWGESGETRAGSLVIQMKMYPLPLLPSTPNMIINDSSIIEIPGLLVMSRKKRILSGTVSVLPVSIVYVRNGK